jgi:beta-mannosidase
MRAIFLFKLFAYFILLSSNLAASASPSFTGSSKRMDLSGSWEFQTAELRPVAPEAYLPSSNISNVGAWQAINVPNNWYLEGQNIHGKAWYRKSFAINESIIGRYIRLNFQGVDYAADVWLNGKYLGHHEGYFQPFDFDVSKKIRKGENNLMVLVDSPIEDPTNAWSLKKRLIKGIFSHHDTRPGGAWSARGQEKNTGGIWAPVHLDISDGLALRQLEVSPQKNITNWTVNSTLTLGSKLPNNSEVIAEGVIEPVNFTGTKVQFKQVKRISQGDSQVLLTSLVKQPKLWWPAGHGDPNLYRVKIKLSHAGRLLDYREAVFGFREVFVNAKTQEWHINGRRMFIRGTNYISSQWLAEMTPSRYANDIELMQRANINAVRVHAHIEADNFYQLCDQMGLLVFQDFPLQWG